MLAVFVEDAHEGSRLVDQMGHPWTREQWLALRESIDAYFATNPDAQIDQEREAFYERYFGAGRKQRAVVDPPPKLPKPGYIYLLHGEGTAWYKIGISVQPTARRHSLGTNSPFPINTVSCYDVEDMLGVEAWWHETFAHKRKHGEWFELDEYDILLFDAQEGRPIR